MILDEILYAVVPLWLLSWMFITWILFLAVMKLQDVQRTAGFTKVNIVPAWLILIIGLVYDFTLNIAMSIVMLDLPRISPLNLFSAIATMSFRPVENDEYLLSPHVERLTHSTGNSIRERYARGWARFICRNFLVPVDPTHCGKKF